jgi:hypothetical protein
MLSEDERAKTLGAEQASVVARMLLDRSKTTLDKGVRRELGRRAFLLAQLADQLENDVRAERMTDISLVPRSL